MKWMAAKKRHYLFIALIVWVLATLACNRTVPTPTPQIETMAPTLSAAPFTDTPSPGETPLPTTVGLTPTAGTPACVYDADFVTDVTIPDDTELKPDTGFVKTWRMRNSGTCAWETGSSWIFKSGDKMGGPDTVNVPVVEPGDTVDISVRLTAPKTPSTFTGYWQLRRPTGETFGTNSFVRIVVLGETPTPTSTPTPTLTPTGAPVSGPVIRYFRADVSEMYPGETITLEWKIEDVNSVTLYHLMPTGQLGSYWEVKPEDSLAYEIASEERNSTDFLLIAVDDAGRKTQASLSVTLLCPDEWFFAQGPDECPASPPITSAAAEQHFERGTMIWVEEQDVIYVLFDDGSSPQWKVYVDEWDEGDPESDPDLTPPDDRYQPVRGFGLLWREGPGVRDRLGWAVDTEAGFTTSVQRTSRPKYNDIYIRALDGRVWRLWPESSDWAKIP